MKALAFLLIFTLFVNVFDASPLTKDDDKPSTFQERVAGGLMKESEAMDLLRRITREAAKVNAEGVKGTGGCKYRKGHWSACDPQTRQRTRTFTLKKGDATICESTKTLRKECKVKNKGKQRNGNRKGGAKTQNQETPAN